MYICGTGIISPQPSFGHGPFLEEMAEHRGEEMRCIEPEYKDLLDPKLIRRRSRIIRFGTAAAMDCLKEAGWNSTDAIITGTAYGCLEDTGVFLSRLVEFKEQMLTPTAFIQSTHNTIGAQIGLSLKCHSYNNTFVHRAFSFEHALLDAWMLFKEGQADNALVGAADEITGYSQAIIRRFGIYRKCESNFTLFEKGQKGTMAGEGASFFALQKQAGGKEYAKIDAIKTLLLENPAAGTMETEIQLFLSAHSVSITDLDLVLLGYNGDFSHDAALHHLASGMFEDSITSGFKQYCGEYPTSSAFALWMAANICKNNSLPSSMGGIGLEGFVRVLIYNVDLLGHHSLILVSSC